MKHIKPTDYDVNSVEILEQFVSRITRVNDCWIWTGASDRYGYLYIDGKPIRAHRISYELFVGKIKEGHVICHKCDTPLCVNPKHLFPGTQKENLLDAQSKGRRPTRNPLNAYRVSRIKKSKLSNQYWARKYNCPVALVAAMRDS